jgi:hypothetical protein
MKLRLLAIVSLVTPLLINCSTLPEIEPYSPEKPQDAQAEDALPYGQAISDNVFKEDSMTEDGEEENSDDDDSYAMEDAQIDTETEELAPQPVKKTSRSIASATFKNGFYTFSSQCAMKVKPDENSAEAGNVQAGKKLWLDGHNGEWLKAYKKSGTVFVPSHCVK